MIPKPWQTFLAQQREERSRLKLVRRVRTVRPLGGARIQIGSREYVNFSSNDYLGLAGDLRIAEAAAVAAGRFGWGAGASRLVTGSTMLHTKLEQEIATQRGTESALLFGSGFQANLGVLAALLVKGDTALSDIMNHASIVAGCRLSGATIRVYRHLDYADLEARLGAAGNGRKLVVTDSLFSIEGDVADLPRIVRLCDRYGALLVVDDAHGNSALGKRGRGIPEVQGVAHRIPITVGTFSKALGSYGGFVACSEEMREYLVNHSRPFIYTTAMPLALAAANLEALQIVKTEGEALRAKLAQNVRFLRQRLETLGFTLTGSYHIIGVPVGDPDRVTQFADLAEQRGVVVHPMRWPTVPEGRDALRISVSAAHTEEDLVRLASALRAARSKIAGRETARVANREPKRPTHPTLSVAAMVDHDEETFAQAAVAPAGSLAPMAMDDEDFTGMEASPARRSVLSQSDPAAAFAQAGDDEATVLASEEAKPGTAPRKRPTTKRRTRPIARNARRK